MRCPVPANLSLAGPLGTAFKKVVKPVVATATSKVLRTYTCYKISLFSSSSNCNPVKVHPLDETVNQDLMCVYACKQIIHTH